MAETSNTTQLVFDIIQEGVKQGILNLHHDGKGIENNTLSIHEKPVVSFSSCSYLGLEYDNRLRNASKAAIDDYGTQFSSSRAYIGLGLYEKLESLLEDIFGHKTIISSTTTLGHISALPILVEEGDAVILDHQVHHSVQTAAGLLRAKRVHIEMIRHNNMDMLEQRINHLKGKYRKIWYLADGVYSMYGDLARLKDIEQLLKRYNQFHFYVDDAHGMSYMGPKGSGFVCSQMKLHPRMVLATSLNKAFATGGGVLIIPDEKLRLRVKTCGSTFITSGPLQPSALGAGIASAQIHLSDEMPAMQEELASKIRFARMMIKKFELPLISTDETAIFFIGLGTPKLGYKLVKKMLDQGFLLNLGIFPAVPIKNTGVRFTITRMHTYPQISDMLSALKEAFDATLTEEHVHIGEIYKAFGIKAPEEQATELMTQRVIRQSLSLHTTRYSTILDINKEDWNKMYLGRGAFDWNGLASLEHIFSNNEKPEDNWSFDYVVVADTNNQPIAATFLTTGLWKDDLQSPAEISEKIEKLRIEDPYYLVSKVTSAGSLITEGEHVFVNKQSPLWKDALQCLLKEMGHCAEDRGTETLFVRDMPEVDDETTNLISENGFFKVSMGATHTHDLTKWNNIEEFQQQLTKNSKSNFRRYVRRYANDYSFAPVANPTGQQIDKWYNLYLQVKNKNLDLNTFALPKKFFKEIIQNKNWEACELTDKKSGEILSVVFSYISGKTYIPTVIGIDYHLMENHHSYKQSLYRTLVRGKEMGCNVVYLGFGASQEKRKVNAMPVETYAFVQAKDNFNQEFLHNLHIVTEKK